jgi:trans-aconitate 2-methyltransferase
MPWDPDIYMKFAGERTRPAVEWLARVPVAAPDHVIDLGCGPGNSTALLVARWPQANIDGLESSPEMLAKARASQVAPPGSKAMWSPGRQPSATTSSSPTLHSTGFPIIARCCRS